MSTSNPFADLTAHQELLKQLQEATAACLRVVSESQEVLTQLSNHNIDVTAHPDLRKIVDQVGNLSEESFLQQMEMHDTSTSAHAALVANLKATLADTSSIRKTIDQIVGNHNTSETSHSDMRATLNSLSATVGNVDLTLMSQDLYRIVDEIDNVIHEQIINLQTKDAYHDELIEVNQVKIAEIFDKLKEFEGQFGSITQEQTSYQELLDKVDCDQYAIDVARRLGYPANAADAPAIINMKTTLPTYVASNSSVNFMITGAQSSNNVKYKIISTNPALSFSKVDDISSAENIVLTTNNLGVSGTKFYFIVEAKDVSTNKAVYMGVAAMATKPVSIATLTLSGLPKRVEPGQTYTFEIRNIQDANTGRLSYDIDAADSGMLFDVYQNLHNNDTVNMTVPTNHARDVDYTFTVVVKDAYGPSQEKHAVVHTNPLPGAEDFKHNVPTVVIPGKSYYVAFSGIKDSTGRALEYRISSPNSFLEFSKTENILPNENVQVNVHPDSSRGATLTFIVETIGGETSEGVKIPLATNVNRLPIADSINTTLDTEMPGGQHLAFSISGGTDPDGESNLVYSIDAGTTGFVFSRVKNIKSSDTIYVQIPKVAARTVKSFFISVTDAQGETCVDPKQIDLIILPIFAINKPAITYPAEGQAIPVDFTMKFTECDVYVDVN